MFSARTANSAPSNLSSAQIALCHLDAAMLSAGGALLPVPAVVVALCCSVFGTFLILVF